ncbi:uncharacterized protein IWZ02DRAFT_209642 [Phyllosticta citriasiana]|uniref:uncharacterized protein n=1 Tax=Phyllosticta citriasiana TaxID=595635 RepID=UPI0030FD3D55
MWTEYWLFSLFTERAKLSWQAVHGRSVGRPVNGRNRFNLAFFLYPEYHLLQSLSRSHISLPPPSFYSLCTAKTMMHACMAWATYGCFSILLPSIGLHYWLYNFSTFMLLLTRFFSILIVEVVGSIPPDIQTSHLLLSMRGPSVAA